MRKNFLSFLMLLASSSSFAVEDITSGTSYYIQNAESGLFLCGANAWGTRASVAAEGDVFTLNGSDGAYSILDATLTTANKCLGDNLFVDNNSGDVKFTFAHIGGGIFTIARNGKYLAQATAAATVTGHEVDTVDVVTDAAKWYILTKEEAIKKLASATENNPLSATFLLTNPNFSRNHSTAAWTMVASSQKNISGNNNNFCAESWHSTFTFSQTLTGMLNGVYTLSAQGFYRQDGSDNDNLPVFYLNGTTVAFPERAGTESDMYAASTSFNGGTKYLVTTEKVTVTDGTITVGAKNESNVNLWCIWDNFQLTYYGAITDFSTYVTALKEQVTAGQAIKDSVMNGAVQTALNNAISEYSSKTQISSYQSEDEWSKAISAMKAAVKNAQTSIDNYATAKTYLDAASKLDETGKASYADDETVKALKTAYDAKTLEAVTAEQETALAEALRTAAKAQTTEGADMTLAIVNPTIDGATGWTTLKPGGGNGPLLNNIKFEYWNASAANGAFDYYQEITGLPAGKYTVSAEMFNSTNGESGAAFSATSGVYASSGNSEVYKLVDVDGGEDSQKKYTTDNIVVTNGTLRIGVKNQKTMAARWFVADNFTLTFVEPVTVQKATLTEESGLTPLTNLAGNPVDVSFTRNFTKDVSSTVCLPFEVTPETGVGKFYAFKGVTEKDGVYTVTMTETATTLAANAPYLFVPAADGDVTFTGTVAKAAATYTPTDVTEGEWTFVGTYSKVTYDAEDKWGDYAAIYGFVAKNLDEAQTFKAGEFVKMKKPGSSYTPAFRAVMKYKQATDGGADANVRRSVTIPSSLNVVLENEDGTTTAIGTVDVDTDYADGAWYTIDGRKIQGKPTAKGIYINGGQKVLIK